MRIPLSRIYRAFPELDRFTDDQCSRFVRAACKRGWRRHLHRALLVILTPLAVMVSWIVFGLGFGTLTDSLGRSFEDTIPFFVLVILGLTLSCAVPVLSAMLIRDRLLLGRIRFVLRARGTCPACRYSLLGIVVAQSNLVICPECGMEVEADPSLNELTTDDEGRARFTPTESIKIRRFWTPKRVRRAKLAAKLLAAFVFVVLPLCWGGYEVFLRRQAAAAAADRPGVEGALEFIEAHQPPGVTPEDTNAWDLFYEAERVLERVTATTPQPQSSSGAPVDALYELFFDPGSVRTASEPDADQIEQDELCRQYALLLLRAGEEQGLFETLSELAACRRVVRVPASAGGDPLGFEYVDEFNTLRDLSRMNAARMHLALEAGDLGEFAAALEVNLALTRLADHEPGMSGYIDGHLIEQIAHQQITRGLARHPGADWLDEIEATLRRQRSTLSRGDFVQGELLQERDTLAWFFSAPKNARFGRLGANFFGGFSFESLSARLGTYQGNLNLLMTYYERVAREVEMDPYLRTTGLQYTGPTDLILLSILLVNWERMSQNFDTREARRRATTTMLALERYYLAHQAYPETLAPLVPDYLPALPPDPWTGNPLIYRPTAPDNQTYLLYAVGPDATDSGGDGGGGRWAEPDVVFSPGGD